MGKVALTLNLDAELVAKAQAAGIDLQTFADNVLRREVERREAQGVQETGPAPLVPPASEEERAARWAEENAAAIADHRKRIEEHGVFGEDFRTW